MATSKKKAPKSAFYGPAGGFFSQKKKVVLGNIKHSGNEKNIFLNKSELGNNVFSNVDSLSDNKKGVNMTGINVGSLLDLAVNTLKAKHVNIGAVFVNGFGGATTLSKFERIIYSTFTSEKSMEMTASLAREKEITVNTNLKKQEICSDRTVVIKKILMNTPKEMIVTTVSIFREIKLIKIQLIKIWLNWNRQSNWHQDDHS
ncbi:hypothetical protein G9A89_015458 [Geosiphon pyriformis]|nr:hypothetical protein G9A89_015458 [Geosiphon pyriformis]